MQTYPVCCLLRVSIKLASRTCKCSLATRGLGKVDLSLQYLLGIKICGHDLRKPCRSHVSYRPQYVLLSNGWASLGMCSASLVSSAQTPKMASF